MSKHIRLQPALKAKPWEVPLKAALQAIDAYCTERYPHHATDRHRCATDLQEKWVSAGELAYEYGIIDAAHYRRLNLGRTRLPLPQQLYHVTTDLPSILRTGLRSRRRAARFGRACGLGGAAGNTVSFTDDPKIAANIRRGILVMAELMRSPATAIPKMWTAAAQGPPIAVRPWLETAIPYEYRPLDSRPGPAGRRIAKAAAKALGERLPGTDPEFDRLVEVGLIMEDAILVPAPPGGLPPLKDRVWERKDRPILQRLSSCAREANKTTCQNRLWDFYRTWATEMQRAGGPEDPYFCNPSRTKFAAVEPSDVGILTLEPCPGARGAYAGDKHNREWRTSHPRTVRLVAVDGKRPPKGTRPSMLKCPKVYTTGDIQKPKG